ncbi:MAG: hypothetical protein H6722_25705 [Sandaracinus sp.]|nr:hypothetical protein [Sandaracinus sp.]
MRERSRGTNVRAMTIEGPGILQNEAARASLEGAGGLLGDLLCQASGYGPAPTAHLAEFQAGAVFLWMRFARGSFRDPRRETFVRQIATAQTFLRPTLTEAHSALEAYVAGDEPYVRWSVLPPRLSRIFYGADAERLTPAEQGWAEAPSGVFELPGVQALVEELVDESVFLLDEDFDTPEICADPRREAYGIGRLALLLVLDGVHVDPARFARWRDAWHAGRRAPTGALDEAFDLALEDAFAYGIEHFSR